MKLKKRITAALNITSASLIASIFLPIIPCRTLSVVPSRPLQWSFCSLNPDTYAANISAQKFFGFTTSLMDAWITLIVVVFIVIYFAGKYVNFGFMKGG